MSEKQVLILLHGMGKHTAESFTAEVTEAADNALHRYPGYEDVSFTDKVHLHCIDYDHIFEELRQKMSEEAQGIKQFISGYQGGAELPGFIDELIALDASFGEDEFAYTHALDVIFYLTLVGERVRSHTATKMLEIINGYPGGTKINFMAHSLGTAVLHDTLHKLYTDGIGDHQQLNSDQHRLQSVWMFANVSRLVTSVTGLTDPYDSVVKPGIGGCVTQLFNGFHVLDPFVLQPFKRFDPPNDGAWISKGVYKSFYKRFELRKVSRKNTHSIQGYIEDPVVCHRFLNHFFDFKPGKEAKKKGDDEFRHLESEWEKIKAFAEEIDSAADIVAFIRMLKDFDDFL